MQRCKVLVICLGLCILSGCSAFGVPYTSDPNQKLAYAFRLINEERPIPAERLTGEALETLNANADKRGMAEAYRMYGFIYRSSGVQKFEKFYRDNGFRDKTVTLDNRYTKSIEYFEKAKDIYAENKMYGELTNVYLNMGFTYELMHNQSAACTAFDQSLENNREFHKANPDTKIDLPSGYTSYEEFALLHKKRVGCL